jgi:subtilisin family serine protease
VRTAAVAEPGELLVVFKPAAEAAAREAADRRLGVTVLRRMESLGAELVALPPGVDVADAQARYVASGAVEATQPNYVRTASSVSTNDPLLDQQWGIRNTGQLIGAGVPGVTPVSGGADIDADISEPPGTPDAWEVSTGASVVVAVIDGGIQVDHPDLAANIWTNPGEVAGNGVDDDRNGFVDDLHGWDFTTLKGDPYVSSSDLSPGNPVDQCNPPAPPGTSFDDHGTHVAGVLAAVGNNGQGVAGVAFRSKIMPLKFLACHAGDDAAAIEAIDYAIKMKADVINASWGGAGSGLFGTNPPAALCSAIEKAGRAGIAVVTASGNGGNDGRGDDLGRFPDYPASCSGVSNQIVVAAGDYNDRLAPFSNYGGPTAILAPGARILSTISGSRYGFQDGTSMAVPFVTGTVALMLARSPGMSPRDVRSAILSTVDKVQGLGQALSSGGRLNAGRAVRRAAGLAEPSADGGPGAVPASAPALGTSYRLVAADGGIFSYGDAPFKGSTGDIRLNRPIVAMAPTPTGQGYWMVASDGGIFAFGDASFKGSTGGMRLTRPIVGMAPTPSGQGYWLVASDGGIFAFGDAVFKGSTGSTMLTRPIVGMAPTPSGQGYWLVASDGGIFAYGDAVFTGSTGSMGLNQPIVAMAPTPTGQGYLLVAVDGGIFAFGDARFYGSTGNIRLSRPIVGMARTLSGQGYWLVASDGGIFAYGDAPFRGSTGSTRLGQPIVGMSAAV